MHTHPQSIAEATKTEANNSFEEDHPHEATSEQRRFRKRKERTRKQQAEPNAIESFHLRLTHAHARTRTHAPIHFLNFPNRNNTKIYRFVLSVQTTRLYSIQCTLLEKFKD